MKDFREQEYVAHIKCFSEAERYAAKGTFVGKPDKNKGAQKQELWSEVLDELATRKTFDNSTRSILERIAAQPNVPRKKPKFVNFLKSGMRFDGKRAESIWKIIEDGLDEFKKRTLSKQETNCTTAGRQKQTAVNGESEKNANGSTEMEASENKSDNNDSKNGNDVNQTMSAIFAKALNREDIVMETRKLLKKIQKHDNLPEDLTKKKKFLNFLQNDFNLDDERAKEIWNLLLSETSNGQDAENHTTNGTSKKRKNSESIETETNQKVQKLENGTNTTTVKETEFNWEKNIIRLFNKLNKKNNEVSLETLKSKVIKKYMKHISGNDDDDVTKFEKKFNKQLKKVNSLIKEDDTVKLREQV